MYFTDIRCNMRAVLWSVCGCFEGAIPPGEWAVPPNVTADSTVLLWTGSISCQVAGKVLYCSLVGSEVQDSTLFQSTSVSSLCFLTGAELNVLSLC